MSFRAFFRLQSLLACTSMVLALAVAGPGKPSEDPVASALAQSRALLEEGKAKEALAKAEEGLEYESEHFELLSTATRAAEMAGSTDQALWYADLAVAAAGPSPAKEQVKLVEALRARIAALDPLKGQGESARSRYAGELLELGTDLAKRKLYVCAVRVLSRLEGTSQAEKAETALAKIYSNDKAVEQLLDSGIDVPIQHRKKRSPREIAREDQKHATWEEAWVEKGNQYTVRTNMGIEMAEAISLAMEQMNSYYRKVFGVKERGGETARVTINVYRARKEFDEHEQDDNGKPPAPGVKGFFSPSELRVCTYDPREERESLSFLWSTLFHEASHQFTRIALTGGEFPTWLNEGTASYFEGARLRRNGTVESNLVPDNRLGELKILIERGSPTLHEVVTYMQPGSYPGEYYPFGWGLVYFFLNYEDDASKRVYVKPYRDFMATYKSGAKHDVKGRFVEYFVTKPEQPGIASFEDFEKRWKEWILALHDLHFGSSKVADELLARAREQHADGEDEAAIETYRWALRKRPDDVVATMELAELFAGQKKTDAAVAQFRAAIEAVRGMRDPSQPVAGSGERTAEDLAAACQQRFEALDADYALRLGQADTDFVAACTEAAKAYHEAGMPLVAVALLDRSRALHGRSSTLEEARTEIVLDSGVDPRRWRRLPVPSDLAGWRASRAWSSDGQRLACQADGPAFAFHLGELPAEFRLEARMDGSGLDGEEGFVALLFGINDVGMRYFGVQGPGLMEHGAFEREWKPVKQLGLVKPEAKSSFVLAVEVREAEAEFFLDGKSCGKAALSRESLEGEVGAVVQRGHASISELRVRY